MSPDIPLRSPGTFPDIALTDAGDTYNVSKTSSWAILKDKSVTKTSTWVIQIGNEKQKTSSWDILKDRSVTKTSAWYIQNPGQMYKASSWDIYFAGRSSDLTCAWEIAGTINLTSDWVIYRDDSIISNTTNFTSPDGFMTVKNSRAVRDKRGKVYVVCIYKNASTDNIMLLWDDGVDDWAFKYLTTDTGLTADLKYSVSMDIDRSGNIHIAYDCISYNYSSYGRYIRYIKYDPIADSILVNKDVVYYNSTYPQKQPHLQVDDDDYAHILWLGKGWTANPTYYQVCYARSDESTRWSGSPPSALTADTADDYNQWINVDSNGNLYAYWIGLGATNNPTVNNICRKLKGGGSWSARDWVTDVSSTVLMAHSVFDENNHIHLGYYISGGLYYKRYDYDYEAWDTAVNSGGSNVGSYSMQVSFNKRTTEVQPTFLFYSTDGVSNSRARTRVRGSWVDKQISNASTRSQLNCDISFIQPQRGNWVSQSTENYGFAVYYVELDDYPVTTTYHLAIKYCNFGAWSEGWKTSTWNILKIGSSNKISTWIIAYIGTINKVCEWVIPKKGMCFVVFCG